ncbi:PASTA domain-containing protein [Streptomyces sp. NPDC056690]|uniref:PASTA domain-containing protein n=1 Tax=unclassified Streptomyces TaxID=2593676 RepID=UPI0036362145
MPDFKGKSVKAAREALVSGYSITVNDATGQNRIVFMESNWQVCTQNPTPGTELDGQPVKFKAVKFNDPC